MAKLKCFTVWLKTHVDQSSAIGDLARDVSRDPDWPARRGLPDQRAYLEERGAIPAAIEALESAWSRYEAYRAARDHT
jgi:hypothetical protein